MLPATQTLGTKEGSAVRVIENNEPFRHHSQMCHHCTATILWARAGNSLGGWTHCVPRGHCSKQN